MRLIASFFALAMPMAACAAPPRVALSGEPVTIEAERVKTDANGPLVLHLDDVRLSKGAGANVEIWVNGDFVRSLALPASSSSRTPPARNFALPLPASARDAKRIVVKLVPKGRKSVTMKRPYVTMER